MARSVRQSQTKAIHRQVQTAEIVRLSVLYVVLTMLALGMVYPYVFTVANAFKSLADFIVSPYALITKHHSLNGFIASWTTGSVQIFLGNSFLYAVVLMAVQLLFDSMAAYAFARLRFPGRDLLFLILLATMMIPSTSLIIPNYLIVWYLGWANSLLGVVAPGFAGAWGIFLLRQFFLNIPRELEAAARIDGAGLLRIYWQIILPLSKPALIILGVFLFINEWNDFLWPLIVVNDTNKYPITVGIALYQDQVRNYHWDYIFAAAVFASAPLIVLFTAAQRFIMGGIVLSGLKG